MISKIKTPDDILTDPPVCFFQIISNFDFFFRKSVSQFYLMKLHRKRAHFSVKRIPKNQSKKKGASQEQGFKLSVQSHVASLCKYIAALIFY